MKIVAWLSTALALLDTALAGSRVAPRMDAPPVVLVHGIYSSGSDLTRLAQHLEREGREVFRLDLEPADGRCGLEELAAQLAQFIDENVPREPIDLVGFSMGGLVSRYYVQRLGGADRIAHFITLATPHHGTIMAGINRLPGVLQMRRGSPFIHDLARDEECLQRLKFTSFYTPLDLVVVPARSSALASARNVRIWALLHPSLILEKRCLRAVSRALAE